MKMRKYALAAGIAAALATSGAQAVTWTAGNWTLGLGGNINVYYSNTQCDSGDLGAGGGTLAGLACGGASAADGNGNVEDINGVTNGLLPSSLNFSASTTQNGFDIAANINVYYGSNSSTALGFSTVDARQVYMTVGNEKMGTVLAGRNFGLFGFDAIINDMTLLGLGGAFTPANMGHTSLGGLGYGYVYTDRLAQINYTTPNFSGFTGTIGIYQPLDGVAAGGTADRGGSIGWHGKVAYGGSAGSTKFNLSASMISQEMDVPTAGTTSDVFGWDVFAKVDVANFSVLGYYFDGEGMSTLAIGGLVFPGFNGATGQEEESTGYMLQGTYSFGNTRVGINWAASEQDEVTLVENEKLTLGVYHNLTPALTLVAEYSDQESDLSGVGTDESKNFNLGAILFF